MTGTPAFRRSPRGAKCQSAGAVGVLIVQWLVAQAAQLLIHLLAVMLKRLDAIPPVLGIEVALPRRWSAPPIRSLWVY